MLYLITSILSPWKVGKPLLYLLLYPSVVHRAVPFVGKNFRFNISAILGQSKRLNEGSKVRYHHMNHTSTV